MNTRLYLFILLTSFLLPVTRAVSEPQASSPNLASVERFEAALASGDERELESAIENISLLFHYATQEEKEKLSGATHRVLSQILAIHLLRGMVHVTALASSSTRDPQLQTELLTNLLTLGRNPEASIKRSMTSLQVARAFRPSALLPRSDSIPAIPTPEPTKSAWGRLLSDLIGTAGQPVIPPQPVNFAKEYLNLLLEMQGDAQLRAMRLQSLSVLEMRDERIWGHLQTAFQDSDSTVRAAALNAMVSIEGAPIELERSAAVLIRDNVKRVRESAIHLCMSRRIPDCVVHAREALTSGDIEAGASVLQILAQAGDEQAIEPLISMLRSPSAEIREQAASSLGRFGAKATRAREALVESCRTPFTELCSTAYTALFAIDPEFSRRYIDQPRSELKSYELDELKEVQTCLGALVDGDRSARRFALQCLRSTPRSSHRDFSEVSASERLQIMAAAAGSLKDPYSDVREGAIQVLSWLAQGRTSIPRNAIAVASELLPESSHYFKIFYLQMLDHTAPEDIDIPAVLSLLKDPEPGVRMRAAQALRPFAKQDKRVVDGLIAGMKDPDPEVARGSMNSFRWGGTPVEALGALLDVVETGSDDSTRAMAASTLLRAQPGHGPSVTFLTQLLQVRDFDVRREAILAARNAGDDTPSLQAAIARAIEPPYQGLKRWSRSSRGEPDPTPVPWPTPVFASRSTTNSVGEAIRPIPSTPPRASLRLELTSQGAGVYISFSTGVAVRDLAYRIGGSGEFESTGHLRGRDPASGLKLANPHFYLPEELDASRPHTISVKWTDLSGNKFGPQDLTLDIGKEVLSDAKSTLEFDTPKWLFFRKWNGGTLTYFGTIVSHARAIKQVAYSFDRPTLDRILPLPRTRGPLDQPPYGLNKLPQDWITLPAGVRRVFVQITYNDGSKSKLRSFDATKPIEH